MDLRRSGCWSVGDATKPQKKQLPGRFGTYITGVFCALCSVQWTQALSLTASDGLAPTRFS